MAKYFSRSQKFHYGAQNREKKIIKKIIIMSHKTV